MNQINKILLIISLVFAVLTVLAVGQAIIRKKQINKIITKITQDVTVLTKANADGKTNNAKILALVLEKKQAEIQAMVSKKPLLNIGFSTSAAWEQVEWCNTLFEIYDRTWDEWDDWGLSGTPANFARAVVNIAAASGCEW